MLVSQLHSGPAAEHFERQQALQVTVKGPSRRTGMMLCAPYAHGILRCIPVPPPPTTVNQLLPVRSRGRRDTLSHASDSGTVELDDSDDDTDSDGHGDDFEMDENAMEVCTLVPFYLTVIFCTLIIMHIQALATIVEDPVVVVAQPPPIPADWVRIGGLTLPALSRQVIAKLFLSDFMKRYQVCMVRVDVHKLVAANRNQWLCPCRNRSMHATCSLHPGTNPTWDLCEP